MKPAFHRPPTSTKDKQSCFGSIYKPTLQVSNQFIFGINLLAGWKLVLGKGTGPEPWRASLRFYPAGSLVLTPDELNMWMQQDSLQHAEQWADMLSRTIRVIVTQHIGCFQLQRGRDPTDYGGVCWLRQIQSVVRCLFECETVEPSG